MDISVLKKLELNDKEIKIFLALLENGSSSVRSLADITSINRGSVYDILKKLQVQGLVSFYHKESKQRFVAEDPEKLLHLAKEKEKEIKITKDRLSDLIPELKSLQDKGGEKPVTKLYEGKAGIKFILEDVLDSVFESSEKEYYVYSAKLASEDWKKAYPEFTKDRIKKKIKVKSISLAKGGSTHGLDERRWLGSDDESATFIMIYANKCAYISRDGSGSPVGVLIENEMIYKTQRIVFLKLWELLK